MDAAEMRLKSVDDLLALAHNQIDDVLTWATNIDFLTRVKLAEAVNAIAAVEKKLEGMRQ